MAMLSYLNTPVSAIKYTHTLWTHISIVTNTHFLLKHKKIANLLVFLVARVKKNIPPTHALSPITHSNKERNPQSQKTTSASPKLFLFTNVTSWFCTTLETRNWNTMRRCQLVLPSLYILTIWTVLWRTLTLFKTCEYLWPAAFPLLKQNKAITFTFPIPRALSSDKITMTKIIKLKIVYFNSLPTIGNRSHLLTAVIKLL